jgi:hypothetical protein
MGIRPVSRGAFDAYDPVRAENIDEIVEETEWFADDDGIVIGVIALDKADQDWLIAVLGRDGHGDFRAINVESCIRTIDEARSQLLAMMEKALSTGERIFPQQD